MSEIDLGIEMKPHSGKIDLDGLCLRHEFFIDYKIVSFDIIGLIISPWLIQSHRK